MQGLGGLGGGLDGDPGTPCTPHSGFSIGYFGAASGRDPRALGQHANEDEQEAIAACQEEWLASTRRHVRKKERQAMASRLLSVGEHPGKDFFRLLADKLDEYAVSPPTVQIEYRNLTVTTRAVVGSAGIATAGNFAPRLLKAALGLDRSHMQELTVLDGLNGTLKPGRCTLLLGPPGSGKTTFLRVLGNRLRGASALKVAGDVHYNGHTSKEFVVERTTAFVDQHDNHIPNLTVAETVEFAHKCHRGYAEPEFSLSGELCKAKVVRSAAMLGTHPRPSRTPTPTPGAGTAAAALRGEAALNDGRRSPSPLGPHHHQRPPTPPSPASSELSAATIEQVIALDEVERLITEVWGTGAKTEVVMRLLGLGHCRDTLVGDGGLMLRGISGGERKRLTTAEMVVGPQRVLLMDEISTGLDSATLFSVISFFTAMSHALKLTTIISLLQPPPEVFALFDDLLLLAGGKLIYHGPLAGALPHFTAMGFSCPVRKDVPSFLLEITTPAGQMEFASPQLFKAVASRGGPNAAGMLLPLHEMAAAFWSDSSAGSAMVAQLAEPFQRSHSHPAALERRRYALSPLQAIAVVTKRQMKLVLRDKVLLKGRMLQIVIVSLLVGSLFWQLGHGVNDARSFFGAAFMVVLFMAMGTMPQIGVVMAQKGVWFKHRDNLLYPGYAHGVAMAISQLPISILEASLFTAAIYFMVGFHLDLVHFFAFWGVVATSNLCLSALFRLVAVVAPNPTLAAGYGGIAILLLILTSGFAIVRGSIPNYMLWTYYVSPFAYALRALAINEFTSPEWTRRVAGIPGASTLGQAALLSFDFYTDRAWIVYGIAFLFGSYILLSVATCVALGYVNGPQHVARLPDPKQLAAVRLAAEQRRSAAQLNLLRASERAALSSSRASRAGLARSVVSRFSRASAVTTATAVAARQHAAQQHCAQQMHIADAAGGFSQLRPPAGVAAAAAAGVSLPPPKHVGFRESSSEGEEGATSSEPGSSSAGGGAPLAVGSPRPPVRVMEAGLDFVPITLVFQDLRYFVPNPCYKRGWWRRRGAGAAFEAVDPGFVGGLSGGKGGGLRKRNPHHKKGGGGGGGTDLIRARRSDGGERQDGGGNDDDDDVIDLEDIAGDPDYELVLASEFRAAARRGGRDGAAAAAAGAAGSASSFGASSGASGAAAPAPPRELELLKGVSGHAVPGRLMALMGGSGAGKTTLMDVICGRKTVGRTTGRLLVNGAPLVKASWSRVVGYVEQMDVHTPAQTVLEALWFSGRLRLGPKVSDSQVRAYVEQVIDIVDLTDQSFSLVGQPGAGGLSTEQLKRLTIAVELVANPSVVFMDEPTSGLDARAAAIVMRAVRNVALSGRTVVVTIHQPSIEIFESFDTLLLLQRGGRTTYFGPLGAESAQLISYLESVPGTTPIQPGQNPATWMLEVTGGSMAMVARPNDVDWPGIYAASRLAAANAAEGERLVDQGRAAGRALKMKSVYAQPFRVQVRELLKKYWLVYWRTPSYTLARCFLTLCVALIYAAMYWRAAVLPKPYASMGNVQNIMGIMFSSTNFLGMTNLMAVMPLVGMERVVFYRERGALPYDAFAYGIAIAIVEVPYLLVQALVFVPTVYLMIGFQLALEKAAYYFAMFLASISFYTIFGQFMVYVTSSQQIAQVLGAGLNFTFNIFNGFVIAYPAMPWYWKWLNRAVPTTWVLYGLGVSQLGDIDQAVQFAGRRVPVKAFTQSLFGFDYGMRWWCLLIVFGYVVFFRVTSILALKYINFLRR